MFKKKESSLPFPLKVLTTDYLIDGTLAGGERPVFPQLLPLHIAQARIQPTFSTNLEPWFHPEFILTFDTIVAFLAEVDLTAWPDVGDNYKGWKQTIRGSFYFGSYKFRGTMMVYNQDQISDLHPMVDVEVSSMIPGAGWGPLHAPSALVSRKWLHGYEPE